jgi:hypothetical protein
VGHNPRTVKRFGIVWFVCLCLQTSALSAPFVHLHADAAHETDHHDGRLVHRHVAGHADAAGPRQEHHESTPAQLASDEAQASFSASTEPTTLVTSALNARPSNRGTSLAPPEGVVELAQPTAPVTPPPDDVDRRFSVPPDLSTFSLRGPPR